MNGEWSDAGFVSAGLNQKANFDNFGYAFLTLIRCSFGENWDVLAEDLTWYFCEVRLAVYYIIIYMYIARYASPSIHHEPLTVMRSIRPSQPMINDEVHTTL